jgi:uncharacterized membrane protein
MNENVGNEDRMLRAVTGPALMLMGYAILGGNRGHCTGLLTMIAGTALLESAITRVCPLNAMLGIDSRTPREKNHDRQRVIGRAPASENLPGGVGAGI